jgi:hypothetical protein
VPLSICVCVYRETADNAHADVTHFHWRWRQLAVLAVVVGWLVATALPATAFTLIGATKLYVNPNAGYTTSLVQVRATYSLGSCTAATVTFAFLFDSKTFWNTSAKCNTSSAVWDTGWSQYIKPPSPPTVGTHTIVVDSYGPTGGQVGTAKFTYKVYPAPASPSPKASPSPSPSPSPDCATTPAAGCPSPTASSCPATGALPPPGSGGLVDNLIAAAMVAAVLPIVGLAFFGPVQLFSAIRRRRRILTLIGLSLLVLATLSCTSTSSPVAATTPTTQASSSPSC